MRQHPGFDCYQERIQDRSLRIRNAFANTFPAKRR
jgi:hypothetical protein